MSLKDDIVKFVKDGLSVQSDNFKMYQSCVDPTKVTFPGICFRLESLCLPTTLNLNENWALEWSISSLKLVRRVGGVDTVAWARERNALSFDGSNIWIASCPSCRYKFGDIHTYTIPLIDNEYKVPEDVLNLFYYAVDIMRDKNYQNR